MNERFRIRLKDSGEEQLLREIIDYFSKVNLVQRDSDYIDPKVKNMETILETVKDPSLINKLYNINKEKDHPYISVFTTKILSNKNIPYNLIENFSKDKEMRKLYIYGKLFKNNSDKLDEKILNNLYESNYFFDDLIDIINHPKASKELLIKLANDKYPTARREAEKQLKERFNLDYSSNKDKGLNISYRDSDGYNDGLVLELNMTYQGKDMRASIYLPIREDIDYEGEDLTPRHMDWDEAYLYVQYNNNDEEEYINNDPSRAIEKVLNIKLSSKEKEKANNKLNSILVKFKTNMMKILSE